MVWFFKQKIGSKYIYIRPLGSLPTIKLDRPNEKTVSTENEPLNILQKLPSKFVILR